jgi:hypothetical protein
MRHQHLTVALGGHAAVFQGAGGSQPVAPIPGITEIDIFQGSG